MIKRDLKYSFEKNGHSAEMNGRLRYDEEAFP